MLVHEKPNHFRIAPQGRLAAARAWRVLAHGRGEAVINGRTIHIDGEQILKIPASR